MASPPSALKRVLFIAGLLVFTCFIRPVFAEWEFQDSGTTQNLHDICFVDEYTGWAVGDNSTIIHTVDGGETWERQECPVQGYPLRQIVAFPSKTAFCYGVPATAHTNDNLLIKTTDAGKHWIELDMGFGEGRIIDMSFISYRIGWILFRKKDSIDGYIFYIINTHDGGLTWDSLFSIRGKLEYQVCSITCSDENTGFVYALNSDTDVVLYKTENGTDWFPIDATPQHYFSRGTYHDLHAVDADMLWADIRGVKVSYTGGKTWENVTIDNDEGYNPVKYVSPVDAKQAYLLANSDNDVLYRTLDAGHTLSITAEIPNIGNDDNLYKLYALDSEHVWLIGYSGKIVKYTQKPLDITVKSLNKPVCCDLRQNTPNPFNAYTSLHYSLYKDFHVRLIIYNCLGEVITTLVDDFMTHGEYQTIFHGNTLSTGIYFYELKTNYSNITKKMLLLR